MVAAILASIGYLTVQTKLTKTPDIQYKNISLNKSYCTLLYIYTGLEITLRTSLKHSQ